MKLKPIVFPPNEQGSIMHSNGSKGDLCPDWAQIPAALLFVFPACNPFALGQVDHPGEVIDIRFYYGVGVP
jgi:hypothetical protein